MSPLGQASKVTARAAAPDPAVPFDTHAVSLEYALLGPRVYTHGSSMIEGMLAALRARVPDLDDCGAVIKKFKVIKQFDTLSRAEAMSRVDAARHPRAAEAAARLDVDVNGEKLTSLLFPTAAPARGRLPDYDPNGYLAALTPAADGRPDGGRFQDVEDFIDLIRALNECNRQHTVASFPSADWSKRVRWGYIEQLRILSSDRARAVESVEFGAPQIVDIDAKRRFEIKDGLLRDRENSYPFRICFFIERPDGD